MFFPVFVNLTQIYAVFRAKKNAFLSIFHKNKCIEKVEKVPVHVSGD